MVHLSYKDNNSCMRQQCQLFLEREPQHTVDIIHNLRYYTSREDTGVSEEGILWHRCLFVPTAGHRFTG